MANLRYATEEHEIDSIWVETANRGIPVRRLTGVTATHDVECLFGSTPSIVQRFTTALVLNERGESMASLGPFLRKGCAAEFPCVVVPKGAAKTGSILPIPNLAQHSRLPEILIGSPLGNSKLKVQSQVAWAFLDAELYRCDGREVRVGTNTKTASRCMRAQRQKYQDQWMGRSDGRSGVVIGVVDGNGMLSMYVLSGIPTNNPEEVAQLLKA